MKEISTIEFVRSLYNWIDYTKEHDADPFVVEIIPSSLKRQTTELMFRSEPDGIVVTKSTTHPAKKKSTETIEFGKVQMQPVGIVIESFYRGKIAVIGYGDRIFTEK
jgi:hypothetical protein